MHPHSHPIFTTQVHRSVLDVVCTPDSSHHRKKTKNTYSTWVILHVLLATFRPQKNNAVIRELTYPTFKKHGWWDMLVPRRVKGQVRAGLFKRELLGNHHNSGLRYTKKKRTWKESKDGSISMIWWVPEHGIYYDLLYLYVDVSLHSIHTCSYSIYSNQSFTMMTVNQTSKKFARMFLDKSYRKHQTSKNGFGRII